MTIANQKIAITTDMKEVKALKMEVEEKLKEIGEIKKEIEKQEKRIIEAEKVRITKLPMEESKRQADKLVKS